LASVTRLPNRRRAGTIKHRERGAGERLRHGHGLLARPTETGNLDEISDTGEKTSLLRPHSRHTPGRTRVQNTSGL
jgi:hypothetical protein